jgi:protein gp37
VTESKIEWTGTTWNPVTGCDQISPGCDRCYALTLAARLKAMGQPKYQADGDPHTSGRGFAVTCHPGELARPLGWRKPRLVFVDSMGDLYHPTALAAGDDGQPAELPHDATFLRRVFETMAATPRHTYQVLTKRPQLMRSWFDQTTPPAGHDWPLANVWLGTSIEADRWTFRADHLRATPATVRFLSLEPLLGPLPSLDLGGIDWVIAGGESGPGARPMHPSWVRDLRDRCTEAQIPFFFKQWGEWAPAGNYYETTGSTHLVLPDGTDRGVPWGGWRLDRPEAEPMRRFGRSVAGRHLDGRTWDQLPTPATTAPERQGAERSER